MRIRYMALLSLASVLLVAWLAVVLTARRRGIRDKCPSCTSNRIRPSWPKLMEKALPRFVCPYRCEACQKRFFALRRAWPVGVRVT